MSRLPEHRFDALTPQLLRERGGLKWTRHPPGVLPAWIAELDFPLAEPVADAVRAAADAELFGYPPDPLRHEVRRATAEWLARTFGHHTDPGRVFLVPDIVCGIELAVDVHSPAGSAVAVLAPAYPPFFAVLQGCGRPVVPVPLGPGNRLDAEAVGAALAGGVRTLLLCSPHNPTGRVFTAVELAALAEVVDRHGARVIADEVHAPLVYAGHAHVPYATVSPAAARHTVTLISASKGWNLSGLRCAQAILPQADVEAWAALPFLRSWGLSPVGLAATVAAYDHGATWLAEVVGYLDGNRRRLAQLLARHAPTVRCRPAEGTYLAWLDFRATGLEDPAAHMLTAARVALSAGPPFGPGGAGHARLNFATPRPILDSIVLAIAEAVPHGNDADPAGLAGR
jgi:cysteine-S-conjugate beta-lyase